MVLANLAGFLVFIPGCIDLVELRMLVELILFNVQLLTFFMSFYLNKFAEWLQTYSMLCHVIVSHTYSLDTASS